MHEIVVNLHMHTPYSDGTGTHAEIAAQMGKTPEAVRALLSRAMARLALTMPR